MTWKRTIELTWMDVMAFRWLTICKTYRAHIRQIRLDKEHGSGFIESIDVRYIIQCLCANRKTFFHFVFFYSLHCACASAFVRPIELMSKSEKTKRLFLTVSHRRWAQRVLAANRHNENVEWTLNNWTAYVSLKMPRLMVWRNSKCMHGNPDAVTRREKRRRDASPFVFHSRLLLVVMPGTHTHTHKLDHKFPLASNK